jgi:hypothetical protein
MARRTAAQRSASARKAARTRKRNAKARSVAAKKGAATRRRNARRTGGGKTLFTRYLTL